MEDEKERRREGSEDEGRWRNGEWVGIVDGRTDVASCRQRERDERNRNQRRTWCVDRGGGGGRRERGEEKGRKGKKREEGEDEEKVRWEWRIVSDSQFVMHACQVDDVWRERERGKNQNGVENGNNGKGERTRKERSSHFKPAADCWPAQIKPEII